MLTNPPASWDGLRNAIAGMPPEHIQAALTVQLSDFNCPKADVYNFLQRTLDLALISMEAHGRTQPETQPEIQH